METLHLVKKQTNGYVYIAKAYLMYKNNNEILDELLTSNCPKKVYNSLRQLGYSIRTVGSDKETQYSVISYCPYNLKHTCVYHRRVVLPFSEFRKKEEFQRILKRLNVEKLIKESVNVVAE